MKILFVCMANICRSPALEAALSHLALIKGGKTLRVDSCGLGWFHIGQHPDPRMFEAARRQGILIDHRAQQFRDGFFEEFDYIFAVNREIAEQLKLHAKTEAHKKKIRLATEYSPRFQGKDIPDPYYLEEGGFDKVMEMVLDACEGILRAAL